MRIVLSLFLLLLLSPVAYAQPLRLASTTSTDDSGLLHFLLPKFSEQTGIEVDYQAMGTGHALRLGRTAKVDVLLVHSPEAEMKFMQQGFGERRIPVMYNDFVLVGPADDPAQVADAASLDIALKNIAASGSLFMSRGDLSGTHAKEKGIWEVAAIDPYSQHWYQELGMGMGLTLNNAHKEQAYTLVDRGTWLANRNNLDLKVLFQGGEFLRNPYAVIVVSTRTKGEQDSAMVFADWLASESGQKLISEFRVSGEMLFHPWSSTGEK